MSVITRFAPSPTGFLHIGGARTALFNYLFTHNMGGKFLLRIEDTDKKRSTKEAVDAIINGMSWLGLKHDDEIIMQSEREARHKEVAYQLLEKGAAYKCFCTAEELDEMRKAAESEGKNFRYPKIWRDVPESEHQDKPFTIRIKAPLDGEITINDLVQGEVKYPANDLDDMVILRADGTPTYMLAVVVDDHDMGITHIIRGDDHLTNAFRQIVIYNAMGWKVPELAHIPLIHGSDGAKLSKRHGALGVEAYRDMGYLPEAICNYLMSLGWHYGDEETIPLHIAINRFEITKVGRSPSRFDFAKLDSINSIYLRAKDREEITKIVKPFLIKKYGEEVINHVVIERFYNLADHLKERAATLEKLAEISEFIIRRVPYTDKAKQALEKGKEHIEPLKNIFAELENFTTQNIHAKFDEYASAKNIKAGQFMPVLRAAICGTMESPGLADVIEALGKEEVVKRLAIL